MSTLGATLRKLLVADSDWSLATLSQLGMDGLKRLIAFLEVRYPSEGAFDALFCDPEAIYQALDLDQIEFGLANPSECYLRVIYVAISLAYTHGLEEQLENSLIRFFREEEIETRDVQELTFPDGQDPRYFPESHGKDTMSIMDLYRTCTPDQLREIQARLELHLVKMNRLPLCNRNYRSALNEIRTSILHSGPNPVIQHHRVAALTDQHVVWILIQGKPYFEEIYGIGQSLSEAREVASKRLVLSLQEFLTERVAFWDLFEREVTNASDSDCSSEEN